MGKEDLQTLSDQRQGLARRNQPETVTPFLQIGKQAL
jgi:hypothetical protein